MSGRGRGQGGGAGAQCGEKPLGGRVWLVPSGEPSADVAGELGGDLEVAYLWAAGEGEAGHQGDAGTGTITPPRLLGALAVLAGVILGLSRARQVPAGTVNQADHSAQLSAEPASASATT